VAITRLWEWWNVGRREWISPNNGRERLSYFFCLSSPTPRRRRKQHAKDTRRGRRLGSSSADENILKGVRTKRPLSSLATAAAPRRLLGGVGGAAAFRHPSLKRPAFPALVVNGGGGGGGETDGGNG